MKHLVSYVVVDKFVSSAMAHDMQSGFSVLFYL